MFGNLKGWCHCVEEQGRKTLHAHFLLWLENWTDLLDGLGDPSKRDHFVTILKDYAAKIISTKLHNSKDIICACTNPMTKCSDQDFRNLRCLEGKTSIGGKAILKCFTCDKSFSSNELTCIDIDKKLNNNGNALRETEVFDTGLLWFTSSVLDKRRVLMELDLMHKFISEQKSKLILEIDSQNYKDSRFITTALRNLHNSEHCTKCFAKDIECRMHIPSRGCDEQTITFQTDKTPWYTWYGENISRNLFVLEGKRSHADSFVNSHNEIASMIFGCNTNVTCGVDGGSIMYITNYVSKCTQKDDKKMYIEAAELMARKMNEKKKVMEAERISRSEGEGRVEGEANDDTLLIGMKALIGAAFVSTRSHYCSVPMACI